MLSERSLGGQDGRSQAFLGFLLRIYILLPFYLDKLSINWGLNPVTEAFDDKLSMFMNDTFWATKETSIDAEQVP